MFVITKEKHRKIGQDNEDVPNCSRYIGEQDDGDHQDGAHDINEYHEVNPMDEENDDNDKMYNDGINILINDTFHASLMDDNFDEHVLDVPMIDKEQKLISRIKNESALYDFRVGEL